MRTGNEDESLRDDGNLQVNDGVNFGVVRVLLVILMLLVIRMGSKLGLEEGRVNDNQHQGDAIEQDITE